MNTQAEAKAAEDQIARRVDARVKAGMSRDRALMLTVMETGGKIVIVKG